MDQPRVEVIELPIPMPSWNRLLAMNHFVRMKCRNLIHQFVSDSITSENDSSTSTTCQSKQSSTDLFMLEYLQTIRPNESRKSLIHKQKAELRKRSSRLKK